MDSSMDSTLVRRLTPDDLTKILDLQEVVTARLSTGFLRLKSETDLRAFLDGTRGVAYGMMEGSALSALSLLRVPDEKHPNQGPPFPLVPTEDWPLSACLLENTMVRPAARGRGFQRRLFDVRISHAASAKMRWICAGVHLSNVVSWTNLLAKGMVIAGIRFDPGYPVLGLLGSLTSRALRSDATDQALVHPQDAASHQAALEAGYIGVRLAADGDVVYERLRTSSPSRRSDAALARPETRTVVARL